MVLMRGSLSMYYSKFKLPSSSPTIPPIDPLLLAFIFPLTSFYYVVKLNVSQRISSINSFLAIFCFLFANNLEGMVPGAANYDVFAPIPLILLINTGIFSNLN